MAARTFQVTTLTSGGGVGHPAAYLTDPASSPWTK